MNALYVAVSRLFAGLFGRFVDARRRRPGSPGLALAAGTEPAEPPPAPTPPWSVLRRAERCQAVRPENATWSTSAFRTCGAWADRFCPACGITVCSRCARDHFVVSGGGSVFQLHHCDGRTIQTY